MASSRLPGKVLMPVLGKPLLYYLTEQLRAVAAIKKIIIATTDRPADDAVAAFCNQESLACFRGSEDDVLERFYLAARQHGADPVLRFTADCPLLDHQVLEKLIEYFFETSCDYAHLASTFAEGICCDMFSFRALEAAHKNACLQSEREHVTPYFHSNPALFKKSILANTTDDSAYRFTVDEPEDFEVVKAIIETFYGRGMRLFSADSIKRFLDDNPAICSKNAHIVRDEGLLKSLQADRKVKLPA